MTLLSWHEEQTRAPLPSLWKAEDRTGFEVDKDGKRMGKGWEKTGIGWKRMGNGSKMTITYRYSMDIEQDFAKLDSDPARACQLQVRPGGKR